jgi:hypothetical protein
VNIRKTVVKVKSYTFSTAIITFAAGDGLSMEVVHKLELELCFDHTLKNLIAYLEF